MIERVFSNKKNSEDVKIYTYDKVMDSDEMNIDEYDNFMIF